MTPEQLAAAVEAAFDACAVLEREFSSGTPNEQAVRVAMEIIRKAVEGPLK